MNINIREIQRSDNKLLATIIRNSLTEYNVPREGTVFSDPTTDDLYFLFQRNAAVYFVAELDGSVVGGCGVFPTIGLPDRYAELVKLYLCPTARGKGIAVQLVEKCTSFARRNNYSHLYLESFPELQKAVKLYQVLGFETITRPLGNSGHFACNVWMVKSLG